MNQGKPDKLVTIAILAVTATLFATTSALADECDDAAQRIAAEVGDAYALRTGPVITVRRGRQNFLYTVRCADTRPAVVTGDAGYGTDTEMFNRLLVRATSLALAVPASVADSAVDQCARLGWRHAMNWVETADDTLAVGCMVAHDAEEFEIRRR